MDKQKRRRRPMMKREKPEFDQQIIDLARVTRVTEGGKQLNFRVCIIIGDRKGRVGYGVAKGTDVQIAVGKAVNQAKKNLVRIPLIKETIPHRVEAKFKAGKVVIMPAPQGSGIIAGGATRVILEMAGVPNASAKSLGNTKNKVSNTKATFAALNSFLPRALSIAKKEFAKTNKGKAEGAEEKKAAKKSAAKKAPAKKPAAKKAPAKKATAKKTEKKEVADKE